MKPKMVDTPLTHRQYETVSEVFKSYELSDGLETVAWNSVMACYKRTTGIFYAYDVAHQIASSVKLVGNKSVP